MKNILLIFLFLLSGVGVYATSSSPISINATSTEIDTISGTILIEYYLYSNDTVTIDSNVDIFFPEGWAILSKFTTLADTLFPGDSIHCEVVLSYPIKNLPFYPAIVRIQAHTTTPVVSYVYETVRIYFTPYETAEIWSDYDFQHLQRNWYADVGEPKERIYVDRNDIPTSNLSTEIQITQDWQESIQNTYIAGLAYGIPMLGVHPDTLALDTTDNIVADTNSRFDGCPGSGRRRYIGNISGNVTSDFYYPAEDNPLLQWKNLPLEGLKIEIWEQDGNNSSDKIDETVTDVNGNFMKFVNTCQANEGGSLEISIRVVARNDEFDIVGKNSRIFGRAENVDTSPKDWTYNYGNSFPLDFGTFRALKGTHRAVHLAQKAFRFANQQSGSTLENGLTIRADLGLDQTTKFLPNSHCGWFVPTNWAEPLGIPTIIFLNLTNETHPTLLFKTGNSEENTVYHEFGHFLMWQLQGKCFTGPFPLQGNHPLFEETNPVKAWIEGWADAFSVIVDGAYYSSDQEFQYYGDSNYEDQDLSTFLGVGQGLSCEYKVATAIYDLWDGADKFQNLQPPIYSEDYDDFNTPLGPTSGGRDEWWRDNEIDQVSLSFSQICEPLRVGDPNSPYNQLRTIQGYFDNLTQYMSCEDRSEIKEVFDQNRVVAYMESFPNGDFRGFNTDEIGGVDGYDYENDPWQLNWTMHLDHHYDVNKLETNVFDYNFAAIAANSFRILSDDLKVQDGATLFFNNNIPTKWVIVQASDRPALNSTMFTDLCGGMKLEAVDGGNIVIGDHAVSAYADVTLKPGGIIRLGGPGASNTGKLIINNHSRLHIEPNATLIIEEGAQIELAGDDAILEIDGNLIIKDNSTFSFTGAGRVVWGNAESGDNVTCGTNSSFALKGSGKTDPILTLKPFTHLQPQISLENFKLEDGGIGLSAGASISTADADYLLENIKVTRFGTSGQHHGIYVHGQLNHRIHDVEISGGTRGITARQMFNQGATLVLDNCKFYDNEIGLQVHTRGVRMTLCEFHDNIIGYNQNVGNVLSVVQMCQFTENDHGIDFKSNFGDLLVRESNVDHNVYGIRFWGPGSLYSKCSSTSNNTEAGIMVAFGAKLHLSDVLDPSGSQHNSASNKYSIASLFPSIINLEFGHNSLVASQQSANRDVYGYMAIPGATSTSLRAHKNHWNTVGNSVGNAPNYNVDYLLANLANGQYFQILLDDNTPIAPEPSCYYGQTGGGGSGSVLRNCHACGTITTASFESVLLDSAIRKAIGKLEIVDSTQDNLVALQLLAEIYSTFPDIPNSPEEAFLQGLVYDLAKTAYGGACASGKISTLGLVNAVSNDPHIQMMQSILSDAPGSSSLSEFLESFDRTLFMHTKGFTDSTLQQLDSLIQVAAPGFQSFLNYTDCFIQAEKEVLDGAISRDDFETAIQNCSSSKWEEADLLSNGSLERFAASLQKNLTMICYPSPMNDELSVKINSPSGMQPILSIWDAQGKEISLPEIEAISQAPIFQLKFSTKNLAKGLYILRSEAEGQVSTQKLIKE
jgi:Secretion system C-terminal sorting domain